MFLHRAGHFRQSFGGQDIIIVQQRAPCSSCNGQRRIGRRTDMPVRFAEDDAKTMIPPGRLFQHGTHMRQGRTVIRNTALPSVPCLVCQRLQRFAEMSLRRVVNRHEYGDERFVAVGKGRSSPKTIRLLQFSPCIISRPGQRGTIKIPPAETLSQEVGACVAPFFGHHFPIPHGKIPI